MSVRYVSHDTVIRVERKVVKRWVSGTGDKAVFDEEGIGWYVVFASCPASMYVGESEPVLRAGDRVRLTMEPAGAGPPSVLHYSSSHINGE